MEAQLQLLARVFRIVLPHPDRELGRGVIGCWLGGALCRSGNDFTAQLRIGPLKRMEANQM